MSSPLDVLRAAQILRDAATLGADVYEAVHRAILAARPELVPAELPERTDKAIALETDRLIQERFNPKTLAPKAGDE